MLVNKDDRNDVLNVLIDGSFVLYSSIHGAYAKWAKTSINAEQCKDPDQDDLPDILVYSDFLTILEDKLMNNVNWVFRNIKNNRGEIGYTTIDNYYFVLDSTREMNWRLKYYKQYKGHRKLAKKHFQIGKVFDYVVNVLIPKTNFEEYFNIKVMELETVEADDIIAIHILNHPDDQNVIISSDHDFLQLHDTGTLQYDLMGKRVEWKSSKYNVESMTANEFKLCKILSGDISDNILGVFPKTGPVKAMKLVNDPIKLRTMLSEDPSAVKRFKLNTKLIDFKYIPTDRIKLINEYMEQELLI